MLQEPGYVHIRLGHDITALRSDHNTRASGRVLDCFEETTRNTGCPFDAGFVIKFPIVISRAVLNPMSLKEKMRST
jgi:hypothetical protein